MVGDGDSDARSIRRAALVEAHLYLVCLKPAIREERQSHLYPLRRRTAPKATECCAVRIAQKEGNEDRTRRT
jgi:hypothetical protein